MLAKKLLVSIPTSIRVIRRLSLAGLGKTLALQQLRLLVLVREARGQAEMAEILDVSPAAVSKMVDCLVAKGLVRKKPGKDARSKSVVLTAEGKRTLKVVHSHVEGQLNVSLKKLTGTELKDLNRGLSVLDKFIGIVNENS